MRYHALAFAAALAACATTPTTRDLPTAKDYPPILVPDRRAVEAKNVELDRYHCKYGHMTVERLTLTTSYVRCL